MKFIEQKNRKLKLKHNIGMSVDIAVVKTEQKYNKIKLLNRKLIIENEVMVN